MTSNKAGTPTDSANAAAGKDTSAKDATAPDIAQSDEKSQAPGATSDEDAQHRTVARLLSEKVGAIIPDQPKRRWAFLTTTVTATAGLVAGWLVRRRRPRRRPWQRRGR